MPWCSICCTYILHKNILLLNFFCICLGCNVIDIHFTSTRDGRPSGEAYIELASDQDVSVALSKNQQHMGKRYIEGSFTIPH